MTTIITRETGASSKGAPLTNAEVDQNFINLKETADAAASKSVPQEFTKGQRGAMLIVPYTANMALDLLQSNNFQITLTGNLTLANPAIKLGQSGAIVLYQDGTGSRTLTLGSSWSSPAGAPVLSTAAGAMDILYYFCASPTKIHVSLVKGV